MAISDISSSTTKYTVVKGDTFSAIAERCINVRMPGYSGLTLYNAGINKLKSFNPDIEDINLIYVGQTIILQGAAPKKTSAQSNYPKITAFGLQSNTDNKVFATWAWDKTSQTENYEVMWKYATGDGVGFIGDDGTVDNKQSVFDAPDNATHVTFKVKPVSKTKGENGVYWKGQWSEEKKYYFKDNPPVTPDVINTGDITNKKLKYTIKLNLSDKLDSNSGLFLNAHEVQFQVLKDDNEVYHTVRAAINKSGIVSYTFEVALGAEYRVRARSYRGVITNKEKGTYSTTEGEYSEWSAYSDIIETPPEGTEITKVSVIGKNIDDQTYTVSVKWAEGKSGSIKGYDVQYTTCEDYFSANPEAVQTTSLEENITLAIINGLEGGKGYFFRVRSKTSFTESPWSEVVPIVIGTKPATPTTWTTTTSYSVGDQVVLYWLHNTVDSSAEEVAHLSLKVNGVPYAENKNGALVPCNAGEYTEVVKPTDDYGNAVAETSSYTIDTSLFTSGAKIEWCIQTKGIYDEWSEWSTTRVININSSPSIIFSATNANGIPISTVVDATTPEDLLRSYPIKVMITPDAGNNQQVVSYNLRIISLDTYDTTDDLGNFKMVKINDELFSRHYVPSNPLSAFNTELLPSDVNLDNSQMYRLSCTASFDSGLTGEAYIDFKVAWTDTVYVINAEISYDKNSYSAVIRPYCEDYEGYDPEDTESEPVLAEGVTLSVYRHEYDGTYTEVATDLNNADGTYITDPHPSLNTACYRVVARDDATGAISFYDVPGYDIGEKAVIIQWDDEWSTYDPNDEDEDVKASWSGSVLRLPYNIDVSDNYSPDVELIEYIGRESPVSYYGTALGHTATWSVEIPKTDTTTLYALRRLARWMGNVYIREPSGSGYWAHVVPSFSQTHGAVTIPVSFSITKVEGEK